MSFVSLIVGYVYIVKQSPAEFQAFQCFGGVPSDDSVNFKWVFHPKIASKLLINPKLSVGARRAHTYTQWPVAAVSAVSFLSVCS